MSPELRSELQARSLGAQVAATLRTAMPDMARILEMEPTSWSPRDEQIIRAALAGLLGLLYEGRV
jgi:hypothetical protein